jgi:hypothetical protein
MERNEEEKWGNLTESDLEESIPLRKGDLNRL